MAWGLKRWAKRPSTMNSINSELFFEKSAPRLKSHEKARSNIALDLCVLCWDSRPRNHRGVLNLIAFFPYPVL